MRAPLLPPRPSLNNGVIVCDGNSLTEGGQDGGSNYPTLLAADLTARGVTGASVSNFGVGGQTTLQMASDAAAQVDSQYNAAKRCICVAWEVRNHIGQNKDTIGIVDTAVNAFWSYCDARRAAGWKVVALSIPRSEYTGTDAWIIEQVNRLYDEANGRLFNEWRAHCDAFIDVRADSRIASPNAAYYFDGLHYRQNGYQIIADMVAHALLSMVK